MAQIPLQLPISSVIGRDGEVASARLINAYAEQVNQQKQRHDGKAPYVIYGAPGLTRWDKGDFIGAERGMIALSDTQLIAVLGNQVVKFDTGGNPTVIGGIPGSGRLIMAKDRENPNSIAVITPDGQYFLITGGDTVTQQSNPNLPAPIAVGYLSSRFLFTIPDGRVFASDADDGTSINAAAFLTANVSADGNVRAYPYNGYLYVFGTNTCEIWQPDASLASQPFPYSPVNQIVTLGLLAPNSIGELDNGLVWVDDSGIVRYAPSGSSAIRLSTNTVERAIESLSQSDKAAITGSVERIEGHITYTISSSSWTWVFDGSIGQLGQWYERRSYGMSRWRAGPSIHFAGMYIVGDQSIGKLYMIDPNAFTEDGNVHEMEVWCGVSHRFPGQMIVDSLKVDVIGGVGLQTGNLADTNPVLLIDYSDNGGKTFEGETPESLGQIGHYDATVESYMWGLVKEKGRIWRFRASINALKGIIQAALNARPARG